MPLISPQPKYIPKADFVTHLLEEVATFPFQISQHLAARTCKNINLAKNASLCYYNIQTILVPIKLQKCVISIHFILMIILFSNV